MRNTSPRRRIHHFFARLLCLLMLLSGSPIDLMADAVTLVPRQSTLEHLDGAWDAAQDAAQQPWLAALAVLLATGATADDGERPPSPPGFSETPHPYRDAALEYLKAVDKSALEEIPMIPGWNLVSLPEEPASTDPATVLSSISGSYDSVWTYDACDANPWKVYDPNDLPGSTLTAIDHHQGLWVDSTAPADLLSEGTLPATTTFQLCTGWNLIGFPAGQPRHVRNALQTIEGKYLRVFGYDPTDIVDPWEVYSVGAPEWANDLTFMIPGRGYWVLVTEAVTLEIANQSNDLPEAAMTSPLDLQELTAPTGIFGRATSPILDHWQLSYRLAGEPQWTEFATGNYPVNDALISTLDTTLLPNDLYDLRLRVTDLQGRQAEKTISVRIEGNMKIGHFTLAFTDLLVPLAGLDIQVNRFYDSRDKLSGDFGFGWNMEILQGSYRNNRPPGDGWVLQTGFLPCDTIQETKTHWTTVKLSENEVYHFAFRLSNGAPTLGGCFAEAGFEFVDGPIPGTTLEIIGGTEVFFANGSDVVVVPDTQLPFVPGEVRLTTRDGRIFDLDLQQGVTRLEDLDGNELVLNEDGITHSSSLGIDFVRDTAGRIEKIIDPNGFELTYGYDSSGDLTLFTDATDRSTKFFYDTNHYLTEIEDARGIKPVRNEYDAAGRLITTTDAYGHTLNFSHDIEGRREVVTNRLGGVRVIEYNERGNPVREIDERGGETLRTYDNDDNRRSETDPLERTTSYIYNDASEMTSVTDPLGQTTTFVYNDFAYIKTVTDKKDRVITNEYEDGVHLSSSNDEFGNVSRYTYDGQGSLETFEAPEGGVYTFDYDLRGRRQMQTDPLGNVTTFIHDDSGRLTSQTTERTLADGSKEQLTTVYEHDEMGRLRKTTFPDGTQESTTYDLLGKEKTKTDRAGRTHTFEYDLMGRLSKIIYPDGLTSSRTHDAEGRILTETNRAGKVTHFVYDPAGNRVMTIFPDQATVEYDYDLAGQLNYVKDPRDNITTYKYDDNGNLTERTNALGKTWLTTPDEFGNPKDIEDPRGHTTSYEHDPRGRPLEIIYPDNSTELMTYDSEGRLTSKTDQETRLTQYRYDFAGRLVKVIDALNQETTFAYDEVGNQISKTDANDHTTRFEYDSMGREVRRILPNDDFESRTYYPDGTLHTHTDLRGQTRSFEYDTMGRLQKRINPDGSEVNFTYTAMGRRETVQDARGTTHYSYDDRNRLKTKTDPNGYALAYEYDLAGNPETLTATVETQVFQLGYVHDELNRLDYVTGPQGETYHYTYDDSSNIEDLTYPNGVTTTYTFDPQNRLTDISSQDSIGQSILGLTYELSLTGRRTHVDEADGTARDFGYDELYRVTSESVSDSSLTTLFERTYQYDPVGNREVQHNIVPSSASVDFTFDSRDRLDTSTAGTTFTWDDDGNLVQRSDSATTFSWDSEQRLVQANLASGDLLEMEFDADGHRMLSRTTATDGTVEETYYLTDVQGLQSHVIAEVDGSGNVQNVYTRGHDLLSVYRPSSGSLSFYHTDAQGSVRALTDATGSVTDRYSYSAFGELLDRTGIDPNPYRFSGEPYDEALGLGYHRQRWLDQSLGRFVSSDFIRGLDSAPLTQNAYLYGLADPVNLSDPSGLAPPEWLVKLLLGTRIHAAIGQDFMRPDPTNRVQNYFTNRAVLGLALDECQPEIGCRLKPDLVDKVNGEVYEIKTKKGFIRGRAENDFNIGILIANDPEDRFPFWHRGKNYTAPRNFIMFSFGTWKVRTFKPKEGVIRYKASKYQLELEGPQFRPEVLVVSLVGTVMLAVTLSLASRGLV